MAYLTLGIIHRVLSYSCDFLMQDFLMKLLAQFSREPAVTNGFNRFWGASQRSVSGIGYLCWLKTVTLYPPVHSLSKLSLISIKNGANQTCPCVSSVGCDICVKSAEFLREEWGEGWPGWFTQTRRGNWLAGELLVQAWKRTGVRGLDRGWIITSFGHRKWLPKGFYMAIKWVQIFSQSHTHTRCATGHNKRRLGLIHERRPLRTIFL